MSYGSSEFSGQADPQDYLNYTEGDIVNEVDPGDGWTFSQEDFTADAAGTRVDAYSDPGIMRDQDGLDPSGTYIADGDPQYDHAEGLPPSADYMRTQGLPVAYDKNGQPPSGNYGAAQVAPAGETPQARPTANHPDVRPDGIRISKPPVEEKPRPSTLPEPQARPGRPLFSPSTMKMQAAVAGVLIVGSGLYWGISAVAGGNTPTYTAGEHPPVAPSDGQPHATPSDADPSNTPSGTPALTEDPLDRLFAGKSLRKLRNWAEQKYYADYGIWGNSQGCLDGTPYPENNVLVDIDQTYGINNRVDIAPDDKDTPVLHLKVDTSGLFKKVQPLDGYTQQYLEDHDC